MEKEKLLWISLCPPYKTVKHAGGQALYQHVRAFLDSDKFDIRVISLCRDTEYEEACKNLVNVKVEFVIENNSLIDNFINLESRLNPFNRTAGYLSNSRSVKLKRLIKRIRNNGYSPDVVILNWTEIVALVPFIKKEFRDAKIVAIEEDVSFLKRKRRYKQCSNLVEKSIHYLRYKNSVKKEIKWLSAADVDVVYNEKDKKLLTKQKISEDKVFVLVPYFNNMMNVPYERSTNNIVFWGAMSRSENSDSAIWFIENVMPRLSDMQVKFVVVGANPPLKLQQFESSVVHITGFVEHPVEYFKSAMCMVAPLIMGAGIKIKILEGLSVGIPVITNSIGIEGIPAKNGIEYLHAENIDEYVEAIESIYYSEDKAKKIGANAKKLIRDRFETNENMQEFIERCFALVVK